MGLPPQLLLPQLLHSAMVLVLDMVLEPPSGKLVQSLYRKLITNFNVQKKYFLEKLRTKDQYCGMKYSFVYLFSHVCCLHLSTLLQLLVIYSKDLLNNSNLFKIVQLTYEK